MQHWVTAHPAGRTPTGPKSAGVTTAPVSCATWMARALGSFDDGGVVLNLGSAVIMPEVFLKALTIARNLDAGKPKNFVTVDLDMQRHYRPRMNVVQRPTLEGGKGYEITGHHEIMVPLLVWAVLERL